MEGKCRVARASAARLLYVRRELVVRVVALLRRADLDQLHLVELVLSDVAPGVLAVGSGLGAEAGGEGGVADGQLLLTQDLLAVEVGDRHLGGGDQVGRGAVDGLGQLEEILLELG